MQTKTLTQHVLLNKITMQIRDISTAIFLKAVDLPIDIAYYIQQIQIQTASAIKESENKLKEKGKC